MMPIGQMAAGYARKGDIVVCADVLTDTRPVSVKMLVDNPQALKGILRAYGYRQFEDGDLTYWCGNADPLGGAQLFYDHIGRLVDGNEGVVVKLVDRGSTSFYSLSDLGIAYALDITFADCAYVLRTRQDAVVRRVFVPSCLSALGRETAGADRTDDMARGYGPDQRHEAVPAGDNGCPGGCQQPRGPNRWLAARAAERDAQGAQVQEFSARSKYTGTANSAAVGLGGYASN